MLSSLTKNSDKFYTHSLAFKFQRRKKLYIREINFTLVTRVKLSVTITVWLKIFEIRIVTIKNYISVSKKAVFRDTGVKGKVDVPA